MIEKLKSQNMKLASWYQGLQQREKRALVILLFFVFGLGLFFGIWSPVQNSLIKAQDLHIKELSQLKWIYSNKDKALAIRQKNTKKFSAQVRSTNPLKLVSENSKKYKISLKRIEPIADNGLRIFIEKVPFNTLMLFINELNVNYNLVINQIAVERLIEPGYVSVKLVLI